MNRTFRTTVADDGAASAEVDATSSTIDAFHVTANGSSDPLVLARAANAVSGTLDVLYELYSPPVPSTVLKLDYLGVEHGAVNDDGERDPKGDEEQGADTDDGGADVASHRSSSR